MTKPTVLVFRSRYLPVSETFVRDHILGLDRWRAAVAFCDEIDETASRITVASRMISSGARGDLSEAFADLGLANGLDRFIDAIRPSVIHAHFLHDGMRMVGAARRHGIPLIVTAHGNDATLTREARMKSPSGRRFLRRVPKLKATVARVICVSDFIREVLIAQGWPSEKLVTIPLGIDLARIRPQLDISQRGGVLYVGRLVEKKGGRHLIRAMSLLPPALRGTRLTLIGDGPLRRELEVMAKNLGVSVEFLGSQPREIGLERMGAASVLALPSIRAADGDAEGLPVVVMEAQARACPVVMFDVGSASAAIAAGESGLLARDQDDGDLAVQLARILADPALAGRLGHAGPDVARDRYDSVTNTSRLEALYDATARSSVVQGA
ncbi:MAG: putative glycosyltransferase [Brevundimonas sp.]|nr:putative glycosyltransferase [Brevundimonas sp.]